MELKIVYLDPRELKPYERNVRKHGIDDVEQIKESIRLDGFNDPIGIWGDNNLIVEGHGRQIAAIELHMDKVPCIRLDHLTDTQRRDYAIRHNRTAELSGWDWAKAESEIRELESDGMDMDGLDFDFGDHPAEWFDRKEKDEDARQEGNDEYNKFLEKFEQKKTTDDCYTPDNVYDAVADFVSQEYGVDRSRFVRPFYPGGDYKNEKYPEGCVVVDNPPFSILSEIIKYYCENGVKFFLFAPALTLFTAVGCDVEYMPVGADVQYENGAVVKTSFVNNLGNNRIHVSAALFDAVKAANDVNMKEAHKELPKYKYPVEAVLSAQIQRLARYGQTLKIPKDECVYQNRLDTQKEAGKDSYGGLFLISEKAAAERAAAERAAAERAAAERLTVDTFELSDREKSIIKQLGK